jgi:uncharacterized protein YdcH (DUF465 family)
VSDAQLYLAIGLPSVVALIGILVNVGYFVAINGRLGGHEARFASIEAKHDSRLTALEAKIDRHFEILLAKIEDIDTSLTRLEERSRA